MHPRPLFAGSRHMHDSTIGSLPKSAQILKRIVMRFEVLPRRIGEVVAPKIAAVIDACVDAVIEQDQLPGIANRQRLQHDCIYQREDGGIRPDAERQRQNRSCDEDRRPAKLSCCVSQILSQHEVLVRARYPLNVSTFFSDQSPCSAHSAGSCRKRFFHQTFLLVVMYFVRTGRRARR